MDPIWIQPSHDTWSEMSFDPAFVLDSILSPSPAQTIHHQPQNQICEESDMLITLPDAIGMIDPASFLPITDSGLNELTANPVSSSSTQNTGGLFEPAPLKQQPPVRKQSGSRTYNRQPQQRKNNTGPKLNPVQVRIKRVQRVSPNAKKVTTLVTTVISDEYIQL